MNRSSVSTLRALAFLALAATFLPGLALGASDSDSDTLLSRSQRRTLWDKNISMIEGDRSTEPATPLDLATNKLLANPRVEQWMNQYRETADFSHNAKQKDYDKYVELGQKHLRDGEVREALTLADRALTNATDKDALLHQEWITQLVDNAVEKAEQYRADGKWTEAYSVYVGLTTLFENDKKFEKARKECLVHARLDAIYTDDGGWREMLEGVDERDVVAAFDRIDQYYVELADFKKIAAAGLEHLLLLAESKGMRKTFPGLADEERRLMFRDRIKTCLDQVNDSGRVSSRTAKQYFRRAIEINERTVNLPTNLIVEEFALGALDPLDEFTSIIWPVEFREFDKHTRGDFVGVGISIAGGGDQPISVVSPLEDAPAFRAGIMAEDQITHVNGESLKGISLNKAVQMITGPIDTDVTLTVHRPSEDRSFDVTLNRALVRISSVKGVHRDPDDPERWKFMIDKDMGIAYVRVTSFQENTVDQLRDAIESSQREGAKGLILDLRFNPGGLLKSAVEMAQLFLKRGDKPVVSTRGYPGREDPWEAPSPDHDGPFTTMPVIVLVNEYSASASEIVSGALQDLGRAIIVGERTFGKFSVQRLMRLAGPEAHLKLTTARYYLPSGRSLHHEEGATVWGVSPDVEVALAPKELRRIMTMRRDEDILAPPPTGDDKKAESDASADATGDKEKTPPQATSADESGEKPADKPLVEPGTDDDADAPADDAHDEDVLNLEPDPNELPDMDLQLDTAVLLMRLHLLGESSMQLAAAEKEAKKARQ